MPQLLARLSDRIKPASGFATLLHVLYRIVLPILVFILVRLDVGAWLPLLVIFMSKWRIFAVRPRFWPANLRANAVDIMVGISVVVFMLHTTSMTPQVIWAVLYALWLLFLKPSSNVSLMSAQAAVSQLSALSALFILAGDTLDFSFGFINWPVLPIGVLVIATGLICYLSARHFFDSFNEPYAKMLAYLWGYFAAALMWVLGHLLIMYPQNGLIAQPTLVLSAVSYSLAGIYYLEHFDRLSKLAKRELLFIGSAVVLILLASLFYAGAHLIV